MQEGNIILSKMFLNDGCPASTLLLEKWHCRTRYPGTWVRVPALAVVVRCKTQQNKTKTPPNKTKKRHLFDLVTTYYLA